MFLQGNESILEIFVSPDSLPPKKNPEKEISSFIVPFLILAIDEINRCRDRILYPIRFGPRRSNDRRNKITRGVNRLVASSVSVCIYENHT